MCTDLSGGACPHGRRRPLKRGACPHGRRGLSPRSAGPVPTVGGACPHDSASENGRVALPADNRRYLKTRLSKADLVAAFAAAEVVQGM